MVIMSISFEDALFRSVQEHAAKIFPGNVTCKTGHSLAYRSVGFRYCDHFVC